MSTLSQTLNPSDIFTTMRSHSQGIDDYLGHMLADYDAGKEQCLFLPSLMSLSECFHCSAVEVHQAFTALQEQGYDFFIMGFESPITLWYPPRLEMSAAE
jgi:hypothetical protein